MDKISAVGEKIKAAGYDSAGNAKVKAVYKKAVARLRDDINNSANLL